MGPEEFAKFRHDAVHALMRLNEACEREFRISSWPRWDYDFDRGTLTFSKDEIPRVVASIQVVGTTSEKAGTWLWGWANESIPRKLTEAMSKVRAFGKLESVAELTIPEAKHDEYLGWAMTALAARILGSKGAYRCPGADRFLYVVYTDLSFAVSARNPIEQERIDCAYHGPSYATFLCEHLASDPEQLWFSNHPTKEDQWPDAWCSRCEALFQEQGEWNDKNEPKRDIRAVCHHCYESLRSRARSQP